MWTSPAKDQKDEKKGDQVEDIGERRRRLKELEERAEVLRKEIKDRED